MFVDHMAMFPGWILEELTTLVIAFMGGFASAAGSRSNLNEFQVSQNFTNWP
jgi:hypothetical protein